MRTTLDLTACSPATLRDLELMCLGDSEKAPDPMLATLAMANLYHVRAELIRRKMVPRETQDLQSCCSRDFNPWQYRDNDTPPWVFFE
tara:strand:- start:423 stop:686 length:264 start_codon:yes stop_codon:yes gene_type:complete